MSAFRASVEQAIYEREYTKTILNTVVEPLVVLDADLRVQTANRAFYAMFQVSREEMQGVPLYDLRNHDWNTPWLWTLLKQTLSANDEFQTMEVEHDFPAIGRRTVLLDARRLSREGNPGRMILLAFRDITERKRAEAALRVSEERFRRLLEKLPAGAYTCNAEGLITYFNQRAVELWGRAPKLNDAEDKFCGSFRLYSSDRAPIRHDQCLMALAIDENEAYNGQEIVIERPDGSRLTVLAHANPIHDAAGKLLGAVNVLVEISDRKQAEAVAAQMAAIVESSDDAIISKDLNGIIASWNRGAEKLFGYMAAEVIGKPVTILIPPDRVDEEPQILERLRRGEQIDHYETVRVRKDGSEIDIVHRYTAAGDTNKIGHSGVFSIGSHSRWRSVA